MSVFKGSYKLAFTLVELLVVVSIISLLTSIVLAALTAARNKGSDAAIKSNLLTIRTQAGLYYTNNNSYGVINGANPSNANCTQAGSLFVDPTIALAITSAQNASGDDVICYAGRGGAVSGNASSFVLWVRLKTTPANYWCIDSTNNSSKLISSAPSDPPNTDSDVSC